MRSAFIEELIKAAEFKNIALVVGDLGYSVVEPFANANYSQLRKYRLHPLSQDQITLWQTRCCRRLGKFSE